MIFVIIGIVLVSTFALRSFMSDVEVPSYKVINAAKNNIEVRQYDPMIIAEAQINGRREDAINDGLRLLANYIFGNNIAHKDIAMTAPVQQQKIDNILWRRISFIIPSVYKMDTLPIPANDLVVLKEVPAKQLAVITFTGRDSDKNVKKHEKKLIEYIQSQNLLANDAHKYAFYNPPWTLPFIRHSEVMIEVINQ